MADHWGKDPRWKGVRRSYSIHDVERLRGTVKIEYTLAKLGAEKFWKLLQSEPYIPALGALTGNQALELVQAGLKAVYLSGWQVAADANVRGDMYPDQSLYPADSVPEKVRAFNRAFSRADQIQSMEGKKGASLDWFAPIIADAEAGFGGSLNTFEIMKAMIEAGAAGVHIEDQLSSEKKCGHMGGKVLVPIQDFKRKLIAARLSADVCGVPTVIIARTDAYGAQLLRSDNDEEDKKFMSGERTPEGFFRVKGGLDYAIARAVAYAPYCDMIWCETSQPDLAAAKKFALGVHDKFPGKLLAYNCSPSFHWKKFLDDKALMSFQKDLAKLGYKFQFVTLAGFHALNESMFKLARDYKEKGMAAYARLQEMEIELEHKSGYQAVKHQSFVGAGYFDEIQNIISQGDVSTSALKGSTEESQFS